LRDATEIREDYQVGYEMRYQTKLGNNSYTKNVFLRRTDSNEYATFGELSYGTVKLATLELPWKDNARSESCIPPGNYKVSGHASPKFGKCYLVHDVPGRDGILFHVGNYPTDTQGCILVGEGRTTRSVINSRLGLDRMLRELKWPQSFNLTIVDEVNFERNRTKESSYEKRVGDGAEEEAAPEGLKEEKTSEGD
jgi:hypothetical protein